jgi:phthalate 4,5-cis-dihydrodiol dehydrogenase
VFPESASATAGRVPSQPPVRIGVVGLGLAGTLMAGAIAEHPRMQIAAAADVSDELRGRFEQKTGLPAYSSIEAMLLKAPIDAVYIATPHQFHCEHAVLAARHGKHVLVEKPMALSLADCDAMISTAAAHRVSLIVGHTHSFDPAIRAMRDLIQGGATGPVVSISMLNYTNFLYRPRRPEELDTLAGGGVVFNQLPHQIDTARLLVGARVRSVRAATTQLDPRRPTEGGCSAFLDFDSGATANLVYSGYDRFDSDELHGWISEAGFPKAPSHGAARCALGGLDSPAAEAKRREATRGYGSGTDPAPPPHQPHFGFILVSCERADLRPGISGLFIYDAQGAREISLPRTLWRAGHGDVLEEFGRAIQEQAPPLHDGAFGRDTLEVSLAILQSARERREVLLPMRGLPA